MAIHKTLLTAHLLHYVDSLLEVVSHLENTTLDKGTSGVVDKIVEVNNSVRHTIKLYKSGEEAFQSVEKVVRYLVLMLGYQSQLLGLPKRHILYSTRDLPETLSLPTLGTGYTRLKVSQFHGRPLSWTASLPRYLTWLLRKAADQVIGRDSDILLDRVSAKVHLSVGLANLPVGIGSPLLESGSILTIDKISNLRDLRVPYYLSVVIWANLTTLILSNSEDARIHPSKLNERINQIIRSDLPLLKQSLDVCVTNVEWVRYLLTNSEGVVTNDIVQSIRTLLSEQLSSSIQAALLQRCLSYNPLLCVMGVVDNFSSSEQGHLQASYLEKGNMMLELIAIGDFDLGIELIERPGFLPRQLSREFLPCGGTLTHTLTSVVDILPHGNTFVHEYDISTIRDVQELTSVLNPAPYFNPGTLDETHSSELIKIVEKAQVTLSRLAL